MGKRLHSTRVCASTPLAIVLGSFALGAATLAGSYLSILAATVCAAIALVSGFWAVWVHALGRASHSIVTLRFGSPTLEIESLDGKWAEVKGVTGSFVSPLLTIMVLVVGASFTSYRVLLVVPGRMDENDFRWLRVWLKWQNVDREAEAS